MHRRLIQTIYRRITKEKRACPDVGSHWDTIGFQGTDPCTDLNRSMGVLSLLQVQPQNKHASVVRSPAGSLDEQCVYVFGKCRLDYYHDSA